MTRQPTSIVPTAVRWVAEGVVAGAGLAAAGYAAYAGMAWMRYGRPAAPRHDQTDPHLDRFMPAYDIVERHHIEVNAPAEAVMEAAKEQVLERMPLIRAIFAARQLVMGGDSPVRELPRALVAQVLALGWVVLAETPGREIVIGAVTRPWRANVVFEGVAPDAFAAFNTPGYVKIIWTLRADPLDVGRVIFRTETRAVATDADARRRFRRYWSFASPGIWLIRRLSLRPLRAVAESRHLKATVPRVGAHASRELMAPSGRPVQERPPAVS